MKRLTIATLLFLTFMLCVGNNLFFCQTSFKIPFKFEAGGKTFTRGTYLILLNKSGEISLRKENSEKEFLVPFVKKLTGQTSSITKPQLVFDMVANFKPSYTEYVTDYILAEVWLTVKKGFLMIAEERAEYTKVVKRK